MISKGHIEMYVTEVDIPESQFEDDKDCFQLGKHSTEVFLIYTTSMLPSS